MNDERDHWLRAREISKGRLRSRSDAEGPYYKLPDYYYQLILRYGKLQATAESRVDPGQLWHDLTTPDVSPTTWTRRVANASGYAPLPYLPHVPSLWLARALSLPALWQVYLARASSLAFYALTTAWAVSIASRLGWVFCVLGLMPMCLTQAAGLSADGMTIASSFMFFALLAKGALRSEGSLSSRELGGLAALNVLLTLCKLPYVLTAITLLALRWEGPRAHLRRWAFAGGVALGSVSAHALWVYANRAAVTSDTGTVGEQLAWIAGHPAEALGVFALTLVTSADDYLIQFVAVRDVIHRQMRFSGGIIATSYLQLLVLVTWGASFGQRPVGRARHWLTAALMLCVVLSVGSVLLAMYLAASPVGAPVISGVQGRYFIPIVPALLLALSAYGRPTLSRWLTQSRSLSILVVIGMINALCICALVARYYASPDVDWPY